MHDELFPLLYSALQLCCFERRKFSFVPDGESWKFLFQWTVIVFYSNYKKLVKLAIPWQPFGHFSSPFTDANTHKEFPSVSLFSSYLLERIHIVCLFQTHLRYHMAKSYCLVVFWGILEVIKISFTKQKKILQIYW